MFFHYVRRDGKWQLKNSGIKGSVDKILDLSPPDVKEILNDQLPGLHLSKILDVLSVAGLCGGFCKQECDDGNYLAIVEIKPGQKKYPPSVGA